MLLLNQCHDSVGLVVHYSRDNLFSVSRDAKGVHFLRGPSVSVHFVATRTSGKLRHSFMFLLYYSNKLGNFPDAVPRRPLLNLLLPRIRQYPRTRRQQLFCITVAQYGGGLFFVISRAHPSQFVCRLRDGVYPGVFQKIGLPPRYPGYNRTLDLQRGHGSPGHSFCKYANFPGYHCARRTGWA